MTQYYGYPKVVIIRSRDMINVIEDGLRAKIDGKKSLYMVLFRSFAWLSESTTDWNSHLSTIVPKQRHQNGQTEPARKR